MHTQYIKLIKTFMDGRGKKLHYIFYIQEEYAAMDNHPHRFSYLNLLAVSDVVIEDGKIVKNRYENNEELFDKMFGI